MVPAHGEGVISFSFLLFYFFLLESFCFGHSKFSVGITTMMISTAYPQLAESSIK